MINLLIENLGDVFRKAHTYYHFRPTLFGNLGEVAHSAGVKKDVDKDFSKPHRGGKTSALSSLIRLLYYSADYIIGYFMKVKSMIRITRIVIFEPILYRHYMMTAAEVCIYLNPIPTYIRTDFHPIH